MDLLILAHLKSSFEDWKAVFDGDEAARSQFITGKVLVGKADEDTAMIVAYGVDMEALGAFMGAPEFAERTAAYVSGHSVYSLSEMGPPS
ncbi:MAG: hypothetical protein CL897_00230 [Dehalococcoidia bacterium]|nr:hypothetical protein [Dehalococcoidia bacterium]|tara:strand:- start:895 stop:1164 length:270 start_codon:yes stop_codon:yes gene_type:complete